MHNIYKSTKAWLSFKLGKNPVIEKSRKDFRNFIPQPYEGVVLISADFELAWAWRFDKLSDDPLNNCLVLAKKERNNIPKLLELSEKYKVPVTWGTIGHLFLEKCTKQASKAHDEIQRLPYFENNWWRYSQGDWFDSDPCSSVEYSPEWYAPDLIRQILNVGINHEIACHSFSHISCKDNLCAPEVMKQELEASQQAAIPFGIKLETFIFPGHTMGNYDTLKQSGYSSMRTNFVNCLGYPVLHPNGLWEHKATMQLGYNRLFSVDYNLFRYSTIVEKCIQNHQVCNLWFHPSFSDESRDKVLPSVYKILYSNRQKLWITTMKEYTAWLNSKKNAFD